MTKYFLICLSVCCQLAFGQKSESFSLDGTINLDSGTIEFYPAGNFNDYPDSMLFPPVPVKSGIFHFEGKIPQPVKLRLLASAAGTTLYVSRGFYLVSGSQTIRCKVDTTGNDRETPEIHNPLMDEYLHDFWTAERKAIDTIGYYNNREKAIRGYVIQYAGKHPDSFISLWEIADNLRQGYDESINNAFAGLTPKIKTSFSGLQVAVDLQHLGLTALGSPFPAITIVDLSGKNQKISYASLKSKYVLLDFWFSHCSPCLSQFPDFIKIVNGYHDKGFTLIGISSDTSATNIAAWKNVIQTHSLNWVQYRTDDASIKNLRIDGMPYNFLLDGTGKIIAKDLLPGELTVFLQEKL